MSIIAISNQNKCSLTETVKAVCRKPAVICATVCAAAMALAHQSSEEGSWNYTAALVGIGAAAVSYAASRFLNRKPPPEPTTTGYLRWMNIWVDAQKRGLLGADKHIVVLGPGQKLYGDVPHCPLMAEAMKLCDGSSFTVLDSNPAVLRGVEELDPALSQKYIDATLKMNDSMQPSSHRSQLGQVVDKLKFRKAPQCHLTLRPFRMGSDRLGKDFPEADFIHATFSLFYPLKELAASGRDPDSLKRFQLLGEYLAPLKKGGALYVDQDTLIALLASSDYVKNVNHAPMRMGNYTIGQIKERIEKETGIRVRIERVEQTFGEQTIQGHHLIRQPNNQWTQTNDAFAIIRE